MGLEKLFRSFRASLGVQPEEVTLEDEVALYRSRADVALREERYQDALVFLAKILRLNPFDLRARLIVAEVYHHALSEPTKALLTYEKVIAAANYDESNPSCARARQAIRELTAVFEAAAVPIEGLVDGIQDDINDGIREEAAG